MGKWGALRWRFFASIVRASTVVPIQRRPRLCALHRAWPIPAGVTAWGAAGSIHTDLQKGFIRAEVISYGDFIEAGGETQAKRAGKQRLEIKTYVMQDYDLVNFRFSR